MRDCAPPVSSDSWGIVGLQDVFEAEPIVSGEPDSLQTLPSSEQPWCACCPGEKFKSSHQRSVCLSLRPTAELLDESIADKIFLLPHLASAADETRVEMTKRMLDNARSVIQENAGAPLNPLNAPAVPTAISSLSSFCNCGCYQKLPMCPQLQENDSTACRPR